MKSAELDNLVALGELQLQPARKSEIDGILRRAAELLEGAQNTSNPLSVRFSLAYSAAHALAHGALRMAGYRSKRRGVAFQCIVHVLPCSDDEAATLITAHGIRNDVEYDGLLDPHLGFVEDLLNVARLIQDRALSRWQDLRPTLSSAESRGGSPAAGP